MDNFILLEKLFPSLPLTSPAFPPKNKIYIITNEKMFA